MEVLVLNNSFEPLQIISSRKALKLIIKNRAEIIKSIDDKFYNGISIQIPMPSVVKLFQYIKIARKTPPYSRKNVLIRDNFTCQYCGIKNVKISIDHIIPQSKNGLDVWENVVACCIKCNTEKSNKFLHQTNFKLLSTPKEPSYFHYLKYKNNIHPTWQEYMFC